MYGNIYIFLILFRLLETVPYSQARAMSQQTDANGAKCVVKANLSNENHIHCDQYFHRKCMGLSNKDLAKFNSNNDEIWFCKSCKNCRMKRKIIRSNMTTRSDSVSSLEVVDKNTNSKRNPFSVNNKQPNKPTEILAESATGTTLKNISLSDVYNKHTERNTSQNEL